ncbi:MAG: sarcosine oxidase subunit gamma [Acidimicrobiales bacterium]
MADIAVPVARSPIHPVGGAMVVDGWERALGVPRAGLRLCDLSFLAKVQVRASRASGIAGRLGTGFGRAVRGADARQLVIGSGPDEWLVLAPQGQGPQLTDELEGRLAGADGLVSVVDLTHGRALIRLTGDEGVRGVLSKQCAIDFADKVVPNGTSLRSTVASLTTDVIRDDVGDERSYLLHCERSSGQYLFDALVDAGGGDGLVTYGATEEDW